MDKILYSHNDYWAKRPLFDAIDYGCNMVEADLIYSFLKPRCSHSWRPLPCLYYGTLEDTYLKPMYQMCIDGKYTSENPIWMYVEPKTFNPLLIKPLYKLLKKYQHLAMRYTISVQDRYIHQWLRGVWLRYFMKKYKDELNLIDKKWELPNYYEIDRVDLYENTLVRRIGKQITYFLRGVFGNE